MNQQVDGKAEGTEEEVETSFGEAVGEHFAGQVQDEIPQAFHGHEYVR